MNNPYAEGKTIYLRSPTIEDVEGRWHEWFSDYNTTKYLVDRYWPNSIESQKEFFLSTKNDRNRLVLSVVCKDTDQHIGVCNLSSINWVHRYADIALVIGEDKYRNGAVAIEVFSMLLEIAFLRLNLMNVKGEYMSSNPLTDMLMKLFGFDVIGEYKNLLSFGGKSVNTICAQLSRENWIERNKNKTESG